MLDKFFITVIQDGSVNSISRILADEQKVKSILDRRGENDTICVLRTSTNQYAISLGDTIAWVDIEETKGVKLNAK